MMPTSWSGEGTVTSGFIRSLWTLVDQHPDMFYPQDWYKGEGWTRKAPLEGTAGFFANLYLLDPENPVWNRFIWTDDYDSHGNRVYVGGVGQYGCEGFQIHRLLVPDERWVEWEDVA